jgi:prepilin-type N-terminal cleavage/methylation domain-containing protein
MTKPTDRRGFTLVEILLAVTIIGLLAAFLIPAYNSAVRSRENARAASKLRTAVAAFEMYHSETGSWPADKNPGEIPPEMTDYFSSLKIDSWWRRSTELGGKWDWDNGYHFNYSVSIAAPTKSDAQMIEFDRLVEKPGEGGDLSTGTFRRDGTQYHYIIAQ